MATNDRDRPGHADASTSDAREPTLRSNAEAALRDDAEAALRDDAEAALRDDAEAALRDDATADQPLDASPEDTRRTLHELRVHQIELEMQNEELRRTQLELDASRTLYFHLYDLAPIGYCTIGEDDLIEQANLAISSLLGVTRHHLVKQSLHRFVAAADRGAYQLLCQRARASECPQTTELHMCTAQGTTCWVAVKISAIRDEHRVQRLLLVVTDINERKRAEDQAATEHRVLESVAQGGPLPALLAGLVEGYEALLPGKLGSVLLLDSDGRHLRLGAAPRLPPSYCRGIERVEIGPRAGSCGTAAFTGKPVLVADIATNPLWEEYRTLALSHRLAACWSVPILGTAGHVLGALAFYCEEPCYADDTHLAMMERGAHLAGIAIERAQTEEARLQSELDLQDAEEIAHLGHWSWDIESNRVTWSAEMKRIWQRDPAEFGHGYGEVIARTIHPDDRAKVIAASNALIREPGTRPLEARVLRPDGTTRAVWVIGGKRAVDARGKLVRVTGIVQDITERKAAEAERERLQSHLEQARKMESVGLLAGGVAHDFNNMLSVILGHTQMALREVDPQHPLYTDLEEIRQAATRSADLTRQLLAFARKQTVSPQVLDVNATVDGILAMLRRLIGEDIALEWKPAADTWPLKMDSSQLDQLLTNLIVNARDAITDVGTISLASSNCVIDAAYCAAHPEALPGEFVRLSVRDTGRGMDAATVARIFEPFFTTKNIGEGTGLGLATVYGAVTQNHGFLQVFSEVGKGTRFEVYLPRHVRQAAPHVAASAPLTEEREGDLAAATAARTILVVEDEPAILKLVVKQLRGDGYRVLAARTPSEAVRQLEAHGEELDLVLTDVIMPEMNGQALAREVVARHPRARCLFMSGYPSNVIANHGVITTAHFLEKPFSSEELSEAVRLIMAAET
jgi:PAS domain S-box-containing protein